MGVEVQEQYILTRTLHKHLKLLFTDTSESKHRRISNTVSKIFFFTLVADSAVIKKIKAEQTKSQMKPNIARITTVVITTCIAKRKLYFIICSTQIHALLIYDKTASGLVTHQYISCNAFSSQLFCLLDRSRRIPQCLNYELASNYIC